MPVLGIGATVDGKWQPGIGDPTIYGWLTVVLYLATAFLAFKRYQHTRKLPEQQPAFWLMLAMFLLLLGINKQLDLQTWFTQVMKTNAIEHGWYADRRKLQTLFIAAMGVGMIGLLLLIRQYLQRSWQRYRSVWFGVVLLFLFILIRAASFHHFDVLINTRLFGIGVNVLLEVGSILWIMIAILHKKNAAMPSLNQTKHSDFVEVNEHGAQVHCPKCAHPAKATAVNGRVFKCKSCKHVYRVIVNEVE